MTIEQIHKISDFFQGVTLVGLVACVSGRALGLFGEIFVLEIPAYLLGGNTLINTALWIWRVIKGSRQNRTVESGSR